MLRVVPQTHSSPSVLPDAEVDAGALDDGGDFASAAGASGSGCSNISGCSSCSGGRNASEIFGT